MSNNYVTGIDAIDLARLTGLQLHRQPARIGAEPDTDWKTAEFLAAGGVPVDDFFIDLSRLSPEDSATCVLSLIGIIKAMHDFMSGANDICST